MSTVNWSGGSGGWGPSTPGYLRSGGALALREQWVRLAILSGEMPGIVSHGTSPPEAARRRAQTAADDADEFLNWVFVFGLMTVVYSLSRYFSHCRRLAGLDQRNVGDRIPRPPPSSSRPIEPPGFLRRIDTWCPAKAYSAVLDDFHSTNGGPPRRASNGGIGAGPGPPSSVNNSVVEIELADRGTSGSSLGRSPVTAEASPPETEKEGLGRFIESGCAICFEEFSPSVLVRVLPCRHIFHRSCLDTWFQRSAMCPLCMHDYSTGPPQVPAAAAGTFRATPTGVSGDTARAVGERIMAFRFFSFPGRLRQQR